MKGHARAILSNLTKREWSLNTRLRFRILSTLSFVCGLFPLVTSQTTKWQSTHTFSSDIDPLPLSVAPSYDWHCEDGCWSTFTLRVGNPPQHVEVLTSTMSGQLSYYRPPESTDLFHECTDDCSAFIELDDASLRFSLDKEGKLEYDYVTLERKNLPEVILKHEAVTSSTSSRALIGSLGLAPWAVNFTDYAKPLAGVVHDLADQNDITSASYGYTAGTFYKSKPVYGSLTLGGYDVTRFSSDYLTVDFSPDTSQDLIISIDSITTSNESLLASPLLASIDSSFPAIWMPEDVCQEFERVFGLTWNKEHNLYPVNETLHQTLLARDESVTFKLSTGLRNIRSTIDIVLPYASLDLPLTSFSGFINATNRYFPLRRAHNGRYALGRAFLQEAYIIVDYERWRFSISQALSPGPEVAASIVPIYRPYGTFEGSRESSYTMSIFSAIGPALFIVFFLLYILLWVSCSVVVLYLVLSTKPRSVFLKIVGQRFVSYLYYIILSMLRKNRYPQLAVQGRLSELSTILLCGDSYANRVSFGEELQILEASLSEIVHDRILLNTVLVDISTLFAELKDVSPSLILISTRNLSNTVDQLKINIEKLTQEDWNWWPLRPIEIPLRPCYSRVRWFCLCGEEKSQDIPSIVADRLCEIVSSHRITQGITYGAQNMDPVCQQNTVQGHRAKASSTHRPPTSLITDLEAYLPVTLQPENTLNVSTTIEQQETETKDGFVFLGITKYTIISIAQINVKDHSDGTFFERLRTEYKDCRGLIRRMFGVWRYSHCNFVKYEKFAEMGFAVLGSEIPDPTNPDYKYEPVTHNPPISPNEFRSRFYNCRKRRTSSGASIAHFTHSCKARCRLSHDAISRIPRRIFPLEQQGPGREYFWGIHAMESVSFFIVMVYHFLLLIPPFVFWFLWLFPWGHEGDLQNASIPFMATVTLLAIVWGVWIVTNMQNKDTGLVHQDAIRRVDALPPQLSISDRANF